MALHEIDPLSMASLEEFIRTYCAATGVDRAALFRYDPGLGLLQGVIGVSDLGQLESLTGLLYGCSDGTSGPLQEVAQGERPYYLANSDFERMVWGDALRTGGRAAVPVHHNDRIVGVLGIDNDLTQRPIDARQMPSLMEQAQGIGDEVATLEVSRPVDLTAHIVGSLSDGICLIGAGGWIIYSNEALSRMYGFSRAAICRKAYHSLFFPLDECGRASEVWIDMHEGRWTEGEVMNWRADGSLFPVRLQFIDLQARAGIGCQMALAQDLSQERELARAERDRAELGGVVKATRAMQHEINNPLQVVIGSLQLLEMRGQVSDEGRMLLERALDAADQVADVIRRMQNVTRVETTDLGGGPMLDTLASTRA